MKKLMLLFLLVVGILSTMIYFSYNEQGGVSSQVLSYANQVVDMRPCSELDSLYEFEVRKSPTVDSTCDVILGVYHSTGYTLSLHRFFLQYQYSGINRTFTLIAYEYRLVSFSQGSPMFLTIPRNQGIPIRELLDSQAPPEAKKIFDCFEEKVGLAFAVEYGGNIIS